MSLTEILIAVAGVALSVYFGFRAEYLSKKRIRFSWSDIQLGVKKLSNKVFKDYEPDIIFCSSGPSAIVANLLLIEANHYIPIYLGLSEKVNKNDFRPPITHGVSLKTTNWYTYLPNDLFNMKEKKVLIIEDCVITGDTLQELKKTLKSKGFDNSNIKTLGLIVTDTVLRANKGPDLHYFKVIETSEIYLPWGKGKGNDV